MSVLDNVRVRYWQDLVNFRVRQCQAQTKQNSKHLLVIKHFNKESIYLKSKQIQLVF